MAANQGERIAALEVGIRDNSDKLNNLTSDIDIKHKENRTSIHELRNSIQVVVNQMAVDQINMQNKMHERDLQFVRTQARWAGMATAAAFVLTLLAPIAQDAIKHALSR